MLKDEKRAQDVFFSVNPIKQNAVAQNDIDVYHQDKGLDDRIFSEERSSLLRHLILDLNVKENIGFKVVGIKSFRDNATNSSMGAETFRLTDMQMKSNNM